MGSVVLQMAAKCERREEDDGAPSSWAFTAAWMLALQSLRSASTTRMYRAALVQFCGTPRPASWMSASCHRTLIQQKRPHQRGLKRGVHELCRDARVGRIVVQCMRQTSRWVTAVVWDDAHHVGCLVVVPCVCALVLLFRESEVYLVSSHILVYT